MPSFQIKVLYALGRLTAFKENYIGKGIRNIKRTKNKGKIPRYLIRGIKVKEHITEGFVSATIIPPNAKSDKHIIYYHGGHYVNETHALMYHFAIRLAKKAGIKITMVDYPMAPEHNFLEVHDWAIKNYLQLTNDLSDDIYLMGDSAGGGLALALAQNLKVKRIPSKHQKILLLSPWIDLVQNNITAEDEKKCLILKPEIMAIAKGLYSAGHDFHHHLLSPLLGDLRDIGEMYIWYGSEEVIAKSILELELKAEEQGVSIKTFRGEGHHHDYFLLPTPDQKLVLNQIITALNATNKT